MTAPQTNLLPPPTDEEYASLKASIAKHGFWSTNPVVVDEDGDILDGWTRARICDELGVEYETTTIVGLTAWEKVEYAVMANIARRQLSPAQRRPLLKRLTELYDTELRAQAKAAKVEGARKGGQASTVQNRTELDGASEEVRSRSAAADAAETRFDEPVVPIPKPASKDRLTVLGGMVGASRSTVANDERVLRRMEAIEEAAEEQGRDDVVRQLNKPRPNLDELERAVGLREPLPPVEPLDTDRAGWVLNLAQALNNLAPALSPDEADILFSKAGNPDLLLVQLGQLRGAAAEAKKRAAGK